MRPIAERGEVARLNLEPFIFLACIFLNQNHFIGSTYFTVPSPRFLFPWNEATEGLEQKVSESRMLSCQHLVSIGEGMRDELRDGVAWVQCGSSEVEPCRSCNSSENGWG